MPRTLLLLSPALLAAACSTTPPGWQQASHTAPDRGPAGAWQGTWRSEANGHSGQLRAVITPIPEKPSQHLFRFRATWAGIFTGGFTVEAPVKPSRPDTWTFTITKDLGKLFGGPFTCTGTIHRHEFKAQYHAKMDHGFMEMHRLKEHP